MDWERWHLLDRTVSAALDQPAARRQATIETALVDHPELIGAARDLLAAHDLATDFLEHPLRTIGDEALLGVIGAVADRCQTPPPDHIGPYRVLGRLGSGGMGTVYLANDDRVARRVAVKVVKDTADNDLLRRRLTREGRILTRLSHPNVVAIYDVLDLDGSPALVMEPVLGHDLADLIVPGGLEVERAIGLARQLASGLAAAHAVGVVHRDLRAENTKVTADGQVKILDFGIALSDRHRSDPDDPSSGNYGHDLGAAATMAPEQIRGLVAGPPADLFALGALIYQLLTGVHPFATTSIVGTMKRVLELTPPPVHEVNPSVPGALADLVATLLRKDPAARPTAAEVASALELAGAGGRPGGQAPRPRSA